MNVFSFRRSFNRSSFPLGSRSKNAGLALLLKSEVVILPYLCSKANSTMISHLRLIGAGKLWLHAGLSSSGVGWILNSELIPMAKRFPTKMSWNSTSSASTVSLDSGSNVISVHLKMDINCVRECKLSRRFNWSFFPTLLFLGGWLSVGVYLLPLPWNCGVGNQVVSLNSSVLDVARKQLNSGMASSWLLFRKCLTGVGLTSLLCFGYLGVILAKFASSVIFWVCVVDQENCWFVPYAWFFVLSRVLDKKWGFSSLSKSGESIRPVVSFSVDFFDWNWTVILPPSWIRDSSGFSIGAMTFEYVQSSFSRCIEKKGNIKITWSISSTVFLRCWKKRAFIGLVRIVMTKKLSLKIMLASGNCISTVAIGDSNCQLATRN